MDLKDKILEVLKDNYLCDSCLGRIIGNLLSGYSNEERGKVLRRYIAMLVDSGEQISILPSNLYGIRFRNAKIEQVKPDKCFVCEDFFTDQIDKVASSIAKKLKYLEFSTFIIGSVPSDELLNAENYVWEKIGIENAESLKSEINREVGKRLERMTGKKFDLKNPDITIIVDLKNSKTSLQIKSLYIAGYYRKMARGVPQTKWVCSNCGGKGCVRCKGTGKLYPTSVQEIVDKPLLEQSGGKKSFFHGSGREDIDARCLAWRPFIIEIAKPVKRSIDLKKTERQINKNRKANVRVLKFVENGKEEVRKLKTARLDKTYLAEVTFTKKIDRKKLGDLKKMAGTIILQKTPIRVLHRRKDKFRKRAIKQMSWKIVGNRKIMLKVRAEAGLYIKELISGDEGRTTPSIANAIDNKVKKINLDVIKIHTGSEGKKDYFS